MKYCPRCDVVKPVSEFYRHPKTSDGFLGICKECQNERMKKNRLTNPAVQAYDRERSKLPHRKAHIASVAAKWARDNPERMKELRMKDKQVYRARSAVNNAVRRGKLIKGPCKVCGTTDNIHGHHADYSKPLDVTWLCAQHHADLHQKWHRPHIVEIFRV